ncbi:MAG: reverse transcriptase domain-containing protein [bacterium]|nr:reverse transcriptase domain-containing protein [bacterium]
MGRVQFTHTYNDIISLENLLGAWKEFRKGKRKKKDVQEFEIRLTDNLFALHLELAERRYEHGGYHAFNISDPKPRNIHKAIVRDRLLHHALYRTLYPFFDRSFIADSYSCRDGKGTHRAMTRFISFGCKVSKNNTRTCWVLKCDVRKFFASIDHEILFKILSDFIEDKDILNLLRKVVGSFSSGKTGTGLPLGNLTSQLLVNIYLNQFDQFVKHRIKARYYIRYADDFVLLSDDRDFLESCIPRISNFLKENLKLSLHPDKVFIKTLASGVDFLGWVHFPHHRVLRTATKDKMFRRLVKDSRDAARESYLGMLGHGDARSLSEAVERI